MTRRPLLMMAVFVVGLLHLRPAVAGDWQPWQSAGNGVSVSFKQVNKDTWTWRFRNDAASTITFLEFSYDDNGPHTDVLPATLASGESFGGWSAFTASSPRINLRLTKVKRE